MAYYINKNKRFINEVYLALKNHFGDKVNMNIDNMDFAIDIVKGFPLEEKIAESHTIGGGRKDSLNGEKFLLKVISI